MGLFNIFKKKAKNNYAIPETYVSQINYKGILIEIDSNIDESKEHLYEDYSVLKKEGIEKIIKDQFIPWIKGDEFKDKNDNLIYEGLKIYRIDYYYDDVNFDVINVHHSDIQKSGKVGTFTFAFESGNEYTADMLESVAMEIYVYKGEIIKIDRYIV